MATLAKQLSAQFISQIAKRFVRCHRTTAAVQVDVGKSVNQISDRFPKAGSMEMRKARKMETGREYAINLTAHPMTDGRTYLNSDELKGFRYVLEDGQAIDAAFPALKAFATLIFGIRIERIRPIESARAAEDDETPYAFIAEAAVPAIA